MKKTLLLIVILITCISMVMMFLLVSCDKVGILEKTTVESVTETSTGIAPETTAKTTEAVAAEPIELEFFHSMTPGQTMDYQWLTEVLDSFMKENPNIKVIPTPTPGQELAQMMVAFMAAQRGPDVLTFWEGLPIFAVNDYVLDFKDLLPSEKINAIDPGLLVTSSLNFDTNNKLLGIPFGGAGVGFWIYMYNKAMFTQAGIDFVPTPENNYRMTWDEYLDACEKLKAIGITPEGIGLAEGIRTGWYFDVISYNYLQPGDWKKIATGEKPWTCPEYLESITRLNELYKAGYFPEGALTLPRGEGYNLVKNKGAAMCLAWWGYNTKETYDELGNDFGMMLPPVINPDNPLMDTLIVSAYERVIIPSWSKHPKEAAELAYYLINAENSQKLYDMLGAFGVRSDFKPTFTDTGFDLFKKLGWEWLQTMPPEPSYQNVSWPAEVTYEMTGKSIELYNGQINEKQYLEAIESRQEQLNYPYQIWYKPPGEVSE